MMKFLPKKSKQGVTLVESVIAVVVLALFATGILSLLTFGGTKIMEISDESASASAATSKLDLIIAGISNASYVAEDGCSLNVDELKDALGLEDSVDIVATPAKMNESIDSNTPEEWATNLRGWYLTVTYQGTTVKGFASNTAGGFDS